MIPLSYLSKKPALFKHCQEMAAESRRSPGLSFAHDLPFQFGIFRDGQEENLQPDLRKGFSIRSTGQAAGGTGGALRRRPGRHTSSDERREIYAQ